MGTIIAFEGHNGVGKSTIHKRLKDYFKNDKNYIFDYGIEKAFQNNRDQFSVCDGTDYITLFIYFMAGSISEYLKNNSKNNNKVFIYERSFWSSLYANANLNSKEWKELKSFIDDCSAYLPIPNLIIILTASYETCKDRMEKRKEQDDVNESIYNNEVQVYNWLEKETPFGSIVIKINTDIYSEDEIFKICKDKIEGFLSYKKGLQNYNI